MLGTGSRSRHKFDKIALTPGVNDLSATQESNLKNHPDYQRYTDCGAIAWLEESTAKKTSKSSGKKGNSKKGKEKSEDKIPGEEGSADNETSTETESPGLELEGTN